MSEQAGLWWRSSASDKGGIVGVALCSGRIVCRDFRLVERCVSSQALGQIGVRYELLAEHNGIGFPCAYRIGCRRFIVATVGE
ncbi:hypothetical protein RB3697 [Rhodopirellula baltica SH 1]|uniref:Uncharacterized protein n=1 Tax=Rhodopirellula baltica (strain DSM 10527 / NCIMB 13988 / SH1) TaxID=243090 RepID=Q7UTT0_RHOBA|nr:hypothetical protein RB3697 [Rhodopirellula baltica SH 1]